MATEPRAGTSGPVDPVRRTDGAAAPSWATGLARFAGLMMVLLCVLYIVAGTAEVFRDEVDVEGPRHVLVLDAVAWGWLHLVLGMLLGLAGGAVITGQLWGRLIGIVLAVAGVCASFLSAPQHLALSLIAIALGVAVIWALCVFDEEASAASPTMLD
jgi:hypothetical protein